ncbi:hypothetical protein D187_007109 [Cystobacter fuscus DSM 2262]|uniref:Uncharacterized protein n=1 Tax=Cystobacter fuscus (strain ATCC 25194 / DSM 2262 / NBRC 100088 / M29) TaxID=1242864 RepID=S9NYP8_CYSF2|nr:hypothetical protein D187_007109 [Cystobacter fuscus DSM 2262]
MPSTEPEAREWKFPGQACDFTTWTGTPGRSVRVAPSRSWWACIAL